MRREPSLAEFDRFCSRFVRSYWEDAVHGPQDMPGSEPSDQSVDEILSEISTETSLDRENKGKPLGLFTLRMVRTSGDVIRFGFRRRKGRWTIESASSGSIENDRSIDWLNSVYVIWFGPMLERILKNSR